MENLKKYSAELFAAAGGLVAWLLIAFVPVLEPMKETIVSILVLVFGLIFGAQVKKGLIGQTRAAVLTVPSYMAEIITAVVGAVALIVVTLVPELLPYQADITTIVLAIIFAFVEIGISVQKGLLAR